MLSNRQDKWKLSNHPQDLISSPNVRMSYLFPTVGAHSARIFFVEGKRHDRVHSLTKHQFITLREIIIDTKVWRSGSDLGIINFSKLYFQPKTILILINLSSLTWNWQLTIWSLLFTLNFCTATYRKFVCSWSDHSGRDKIPLEMNLYIETIMNEIPIKVLI